jgi:hypothetical protein
MRRDEVRRKEEGGKRRRKRDEIKQGEERK